jgi:hypothetical protein
MLIPISPRPGRHVDDGSTGLVVGKTERAYKVLWDDPRKTATGRDWSHVNHDKIEFTDSTAPRAQRHRFN